MRYVLFLFHFILFYFATYLVIFFQTLCFSFHFAIPRLAILLPEIDKAVLRVEKIGL